MNDREDEVLYEQHEPERQGRGCLFWGCLITAIAFLLLIVGVPLAGYFAFKHYVNKFSSDTPAEIAIVELPEEEIQALTDRFEAFGEAIKAGDEPEDLELTATEINALINANPDFQGKAFVRIADGQIGGDVSIPLDEIPGGGGRYLNAAVDFNVSMQGGVMLVTLAGGDVNGNPIPQQAIDAMQGENLAQGLYDDPDTAKVMSRFESLEVTEDRIVLKPKRTGEVESAEDFEALEPAAP